MKKNYIKQLRLIWLSLTVIGISSFQSQTTYTFNYTGSAQTLTLTGGSYSIECWGADGGDGTSPGIGGKGGYSSGTYTVASTSTLYIYVGGKGQSNGNAGSAMVTAAGGFNGGGGGFSGSSSANIKGGGGGGSDVRTTLNATYANRVIVAGGGGGAGGASNTAYIGSGGNGGATSGQNGTLGSSQTTHNGLGGTQTAGGAGGTTSSAAGAAGTFGIGGDGGNGSGNAFPAGGGGGGYYGGGGGAIQGGSGGGGSGYIGGVTSATTIMFGQSGFAANTATTGDGFVRIRELCNFSLAASNATLVNSTNPSICSGQSLTLTTSAVSNYSWSTGATSSSLVVAPTTSTVYALTALSPSNCTTTRNISVIVSGGQPTLSVVTSTNSTCLGKTATLTASGAVTYTWSNSVINGVSFTPAVTNVYTVSGQNGCGTATAVTTISILPLPVSMVANPTIVCAGDASTLTASAAATTYSWFPVTSSSPSLIVSPMVSTVYTVAVSDGTCAGIGTISVTAKPIPTIAITPALTTTLCSGLPLSLTASGGISYTWSPVNLNGSVISVTPTAPQAYQVVGSNSLGCVSVGNAIVITVPSPTVSLVATTNFICAGDPVDIIASGANTYTWNGGANTTSINVTPSVTTIYTVSGEISPCITTETVSISVFVPTLTISGNTSICDGETTTLTASSAGSYTWSNSVTSAAIQVNPSSNTIYVVAALTNSSGISCPSSSSVMVTVKPNPTLTAIPSRNTMCKGESIVFTASGANTYLWDNGATTAAITVSSNAITTLNYSVTGTGANGCNGTTGISMKVNACTGINNLTENNKAVLIYPNPSNGEFKLKAEQAIELQLMNEIGQLIRKIKLEVENNFETTVSGLSSGIYFITGNSQGLEVNQKVMITK